MRALGSARRSAISASAEIGLVRELALADFAAKNRVAVALPLRLCGGFAVNL